MNEHRLHLSLLLPDVISLVARAGELLVRYRGARPSVYKEDGSFATEADLASEVLLKQGLARIVPEASFIAEESGCSGEKNAPYCWVIDPLDGTTNFSRGIPHFAVNVAFTYYHDPILAVTFMPVYNELFYALKGEGAYCGKQRLEVSSVAHLSQGLIALDIHTIRFLGKDQKLESLKSAAYSLREMGACAIDLAYIAAGRFEGGLFHSPKWWDVAPGILLVHEAGGVTSDKNGKPLRPGFSFCIASNTLLQRALGDFAA